MSPTRDDDIVMVSRHLRCGYLLNKALEHLLLSRKGDWDIDHLKRARIYLDRKIKKLEEQE